MMRKTRRAVAVVDEGWLRQLAEASADLGVTRRVRLMVDPSVAVPVAFGYRRSTIVLPPSAEAWPESRRRAVLLHELAHVGRHDCLSQGMALLARGLYWPNPLVWWLAARLRAEAERACDDAVLSVGRVAPPEYATHLLEAARDLKRAPRPLAVVAVVERSPLEERLMALLDPTLRRGAIGRRGLATVASMTLAVAGSIAGLQPVARAFAAEALPSAHAEKKMAPTRPAATTAPAPAVSKAGAPAPAVANGGEWRDRRGRSGRSRREPRPAPAPAASASERVAVVARSGGAGLPASRRRSSGGRDGGRPGGPRGAGAGRVRAHHPDLDGRGPDRRGRHGQVGPPGDGPASRGLRGLRERPAEDHHSSGLRENGPRPGQRRRRRDRPLRRDQGAEDDGVRRRRPGTLPAGGHLGPADAHRLHGARGRRRAIASRWFGPGSAGSGCVARMGRPSTRGAAEALRYNPWNRTTLASASSDDGRSADGISLFYQLAYDSLGSLKATVEALRALPGRKAVIFVSEGFGRSARERSQRAPP